MATTVIKLTHSDELSRLAKAASLAREEVVELHNYFGALSAGTKAATVQVSVSEVSGVAASGTVTIASGSGSVNILVNGVTVNRTWATSDTATAAAFVTDLNAHANPLVSSSVLATSAAGVVTLTSRNKGIEGNWTTLSASGTGMSASGARLTGGVALAFTSYDRA